MRDIDTDEYGTPAKGSRPKSEKRQRTAMVSVRLTQSELAFIQARAHARGMTIGTYMRDAALGP